MARRSIVPIVVSLALASLFASVSADTRADFRHIELVRSAPAKDTVLAQTPAEVRLWFSTVPREAATSIRLLNASGEPVSTVHVMPAAADSQDGRQQFAQIHGTLAAGPYTVAWATIAQDGSNAEGEIPFTIRTR
jgi:methionine-rich copper-binding protein CopC